MRIGVIVDNLELTRWQAQALERLPADTQIALYNCTNSRAGKRRLRHALYYALNLVTVRNRMTRRVPAGDLGGRVVTRVDFESEWDGNWQRLPPSLLTAIGADAPAAIVKFGMNLLRIPAELEAPILSYHHGDPSAYRGRPAGFYELLHRRRTMGQIVQILSNRLDAGAVVGYGETKVHPHSYRATLVEAYSLSPLLLGRAISDAAAGRTLPHPVDGKVYRLPTNGTVAGFCLRMAAATAARLAYGAFREKVWRVSTVGTDPEALIAGSAFPGATHWQTVPCPRGYTFLADPFFTPDGEGLLVEALHGASGKGEILHIGDGAAPVRLSDPRFHFSYPGHIEEGGRRFVVPETVFWSAPAAFEWTGEPWAPGRPLDVAGGERLLDPTLLTSDDGLYLFANRLDEGSGVLRLWRAPSLFARFEEHPRSPIRCTPAGSRMAGAIFRAASGRLFRFGQDDSGGYGDGLLLFEIERLSATSYVEREAGRLKFEGVHGPHTLNFRAGTALFDWYLERVSPLAGFRRLRGRRHNASGFGVVSAPSMNGQI